MSARRIAILGLGLIGSSLARALALRQPGIHLAAYDMNQASLNYGLAEGFLHSAHATPQEAIADAEILVLATPPAAFGGIMRSIHPFLREGMIVTDTGSVKRQAIAAIAPHIIESSRYIPAHPIAGSQRSGAQAGHAGLFASRQVILTPEESMLRDPAITTIKSLWESVGARVEFMPPDLHDRIYAYVSHLPQLLAFAARGPWQTLPATPDTPLRITRLMQSNTALWANICLSNADYILEALEEYLTFASQMQGELSQAQEIPPALATDIAPLFASLIGTCLIATASLLQETLGVHPAHYAGAGFADMIAASGVEPEATLAAISQHHAALSPLLEAFSKQLQEMQKAIAGVDSDRLMNLFKS